MIPPRKPTPPARREQPVPGKQSWRDIAKAPVHHPIKDFLNQFLFESPALRVGELTQEGRMAQLVTAAECEQLSIDIAKQLAIAYKQAGHPEHDCNERAIRDIVEWLEGRLAL